MMTELEPIAVVGIGCRFPGSRTPESFWENLRDGVDAVAEVPSDRGELASLKSSDPDASPGNPYRWGGFLEQLDKFDPHFFGINPEEALSLDPKQRLFLEVAWEALEDSGQIPDKLAGSQAGVFVGASSVDYHALLMNRKSQIDGYTVPNNSNCIIANRLSYLLDLMGPSLAVDTACSSSLVAVHLACQSLRGGESSLAIVGGVNVNLLPGVWVGLNRAGMISPDGRCRAFDASANGYVRSEGAGALILKPLSQALAAGDRVYALIRGSAMNQNGRSQKLTAPNPRAQESLLREVYRQVRVSPSQVQYIEANGTGTVLGDYMELKALGEFLAGEGSRGNACVVGTVKANIGHAEGASGIAGLIKVILSLWHRQIPPCLHFQDSNPYLNFDKLPLEINSHLANWPERESPGIAGINSFGFGGTNVHLVLQEQPREKSAAPVVDRPVQILTLGAKTDGALQEMALQYHEFLLTHPGVSLADVCFSANTGRSPFHHRLAILAESTERLSELLLAFGTGQKTEAVISGKVNRRRRSRVAFWFPGQKNSVIGTGYQLYQTQATFRQTLDQCERILSPYLEKPLLSVLYPRDGVELLPERTDYTPALVFAIEYSLAELWKSWGISPDAVMGYGIGESVAACVTGASSLEEELPAILQQKLPDNTLAGWEEKLSELFGQECDTYLEIGVKSQFDANYLARLPEPAQCWLSSLETDKPDWLSLLESLGQLHARGVPVDWFGFDRDYSRQRISLPTYPFQRHRYWIETQESEQVLAREEEVKISQSLSQQLRQELEEMYVTPRDRLEAELIEIWEKILDLRPIGVNNNFFELGGDSKLIASLLLEIEKTYGRKFPLAVLYEAPTIERLAGILRQENWSVVWQSLVPIQPQGSQPPLFGIHVLGKGLKTYRSLAPHLGDEQPIYGLHYRLGVPAAERYSDSLKTVEALAAHYIQEMQILQSKGPYHLSGHSFGGLVAFEMARQLQTKGEKVALLILFDTLVPDSFKRSSFAKRLAHHWNSFLDSGMSYVVQKIRGKTYPLIKKTQPKSTSIHKNLLLEKPISASTPKAIVDPLDADNPRRMTNEYLKQLPVYSDKVTFFQAREQPIGQGWYIDEKFGWGKFAVGEWESHQVPGNHKTMFQEPHIQKLAETLKDCLNKLKKERDM